jgi:acetylornithine deacetylase/succinyl-diaminopimelate desuccinylase-like protein
MCRKCNFFGRGAVREDAAVTDRLHARLDELYAIGGGPGANRVGDTPEEDAAHALAARWMEEAGLEIEVDGGRNLVGRLRGARPELPEVWTGSHLDSVPQGGRYDGALGVVAGIDAIERIGRHERTLGVVAFRDEERGCAGSRWLATRPNGLPGAYVELHIEQGPRLADAGVPLGVVTAIVAYTRRELRFPGRAGHAGTTPMEGRQDALVDAARFVLRANEAARRIDGAVATVGRLLVEPGGMNVIPGEVVLWLDARAPDSDRLRRLLRDLDLDAEPITQAAHMSHRVRAVLRDEAGPTAPELPSGAGHDAGVLATAGVDAGMLFVRSLNGGISHSPDELTSAEDVELAVDVLGRALVRLAG